MHESDKCDPEPIARHGVDDINRATLAGRAVGTTKGTAEHHALTKNPRHFLIELSAIRVNRLGRPLARQADIAPGGNRLRITAPTGARIEGVELRQGDLGK